MKYLVSFFLVILLGCSSSDINQTYKNDLFDENELTGSFSLYPLINNPSFSKVSEIVLNEGERVVVFEDSKQLKVYPLSHLISSEMVNDSYGSLNFSVSYCPITKSALAFKREMNFRASGYLYKDNLTPWDEKTETIWSQMLFRGLKGEMEGVKLNVIPLTETTWSTIKKYYPNASVFNKPNRSNKNLLSPPTESNSDEDFEEPNSSDIVLGLVDNSDTVHIYSFSGFQSSRILDIKLDGKEYIIVGVHELSTIVAFEKQNDFETYTYLKNEFPYIIKNSSGEKFDIFGNSNSGLSLSKFQVAYFAAWWAWKDLFKNFSFNN